MLRETRAEKHYRRAVENVAAKAASGQAESKIIEATGETRQFVRFFA
jgi:hypothetical protein